MTPQADDELLESVVNVSEGRRDEVIDAIGAAAGSLLLDVHRDRYHHRSVFTLAGAAEPLLGAALDLAGVALDLVDLRAHEGVHPRLGVVDVVPFVAYRADPARAIELRDRFARALGARGVPCFCYGPERTLPEIRRTAFASLAPDTGPERPDPRTGACCVGARPVLVAYNIVVDATLERAKKVAAALRRPEVRALAFAVGEEVQVSVNLVDPGRVGVGQVYDEVAAVVPVIRPELVGLVPAALVTPLREERLAELGLSVSSTVEARLAARSKG